MTTMTMTTTETEVEEKVEVNQDEESKIILYNDHVNSFEHVIMCLVAFCDHGFQQAEQCATIVHYKGKCAVKHGSKEDMIERAKRLSEEQLTVEVL
jgi:ATP-dependent Clp protease adaptor protein ClpS